MKRVWARVLGTLLLRVGCLWAVSLEAAEPRVAAGTHTNGIVDRAGNGAVVNQATERAVAFLGREVRAWPKENGCFSCHNNGDAFRALMVAWDQKRVADLSAGSETLGWLERTADWRRSGGRAETPETDGRLADIQFGWALSMAVERGVITNRAALGVVVRRLMEDQVRDGGWVVEPSPGAGSPATYGNALATAVAVRILRAAGHAETDSAMRRANRWMAQQPVRSVASAASGLLWPDSGNEAWLRQRREEAVGFLLAAQTRSGGWGPYRDAPSEVFDTSLALLALAEVGTVDETTRAKISEARERGLGYLIRGQEADGGWPATTRPSGGESYAQRMSTTAWAAMALMGEGFSRR